LTAIKPPGRHAPIVEFMTLSLLRAFACLLAVASLSSHAGPLLGPQALQARHGTLSAQLAASAFGEPLVLQSHESDRRIEGDAWAVVEQPFEAVSAALGQASNWCDVLILHLNNKQCERVQQAGEVRIELRVGKKTEQPVNAATRLTFAWRAPTSRPGYLAVAMDAADGPYDTRDYRLGVEAVPLDVRRTFLHFAYGFSYGATSHIAMHLYLGTVARDKVGFSLVPDGDGATALVGGMRGVVERNTVRYYLAIRSYLDALSLPPAQQQDRRLAAWFDATERYARQLHEVDRDSYLRMKRNEIARQRASQGASP
jgi:hypothetical protein